MKIDDFLRNSLNVEINDFRIEDAAEKVGFLLFGEAGRAIGKMIDSSTKDKTIKIGKSTENNKN